jgi:D-glycero-alpha-D-manno-heptose-7-phosphate kinase
MIAVKIPLRISFFGGGTDVENVYSKIQGSVFSTTIAKYIYIFFNQRFDGAGVSAKYTKIEEVLHPRYLSHPIMRSCLSRYEINGVDVSVSSDIPAGTGLGSSSAFTVGFLQLCQRILRNSVSKSELAEMACEIEIGELKEPIGKQDAYAAAFGGLNGYKFATNGVVEIAPSKLNHDELAKLESSLYLVKVGQTRKASEVLSEHFNSIQTSESLKVYRSLLDLSNSALELKYFNAYEFGEMLSFGWDLKKSINPSVTNSLVDQVIDDGLSAGASGAKLLGAGKSGFILFVVPENKKTEFVNHKSLCKHIAVRFDKLGSQIIYDSEVST